MLKNPRFQGTLLGTPRPKGISFTRSKAGIQRYSRQRGKKLISPQTRLYAWFPACAGMTGGGRK
jgi:hypothetical protein